MSSQLIKKIKFQITKVKQSFEIIHNSAKHIAYYNVNKNNKLSVSAEIMKNNEKSLFMRK